MNYISANKNIMNHAGLGYISNKNLIFLPQDLLKPLSVGLNSKLFGLYYPRPNTVGYEDVTMKYDIMLTPLPPKLWSKAVRIIIQLKQKSGSLKLIADFFKQNDISIVHAESSRSGHRYATWSLHVAFENIQPSDDPNALNVKIEELKRSISESCKDVLFATSYTNSGDPVEAWPNAALKYFYDYLQKKNNEENKSTGWIHQPFELKYSGDGILKSEQLFTILKHQEQKDFIQIMPALLFAELDTRSQNLRIVIIPEHDKKKFFELGIAFRRIGSPDTCKGLVSKVINCFHPEYNIWRLNNFSKSSLREQEDGRMVFLIEDNADLNSENETRMRAEIVLKKIKDNFSNNIRFTNKKISLLSERKIELRLEEQNFTSNYKYDVFLSYSQLDNYWANILLKSLEDEHLSIFVDAKEIATGEDYSERIREAIIDSREMCVLYSPNSHSSTWVHTEWGAAWTLRKRTTPIMLHFDFKILPERLLIREAILFENHGKYVKDVKKRRNDDDIFSFHEEFD